MGRAGAREHRRTQLYVRRRLASLWLRFAGVLLPVAQVGIHPQTTGRVGTARLGLDRHLCFRLHRFPRAHEGDHHRVLRRSDLLIRAHHWFVAALQERPARHASERPPRAAARRFLREIATTALAVTPRKSSPDRRLCHTSLLSPALFVHAEHEQPPNVCQRSDDADDRDEGEHAIAKRRRQKRESAYPSKYGQPTEDDSRHYR